MSESADEQLIQQLEEELKKVKVSDLLVQTALHRFLARLQPPHAGEPRPRAGEAGDRRAARARPGARRHRAGGSRPRLQPGDREHAARLREGGREPTEELRFKSAFGLDLKRGKSLTQRQTRPQRPQSGLRQESGRELPLSGGVSDMHAEIGVFGGSGFYEFLDDVQEVEVDTPYGKPSAPLAVGRVAGHDVAFIRAPRPPPRVPSPPDPVSRQRLGDA